MASNFTTFKESLEKHLHEKNAFTDVLAVVETKTGIKRIYIVLFFLFFFGLYLLFGYGAGLLCNLIGFLYPAMQSIRAIESESKDDDTQWLIYWVVFSVFGIVEFFSDILLSWFPFYWFAKCLFLVWCFAPVSWNGSRTIYYRIVRPLYLKHEDKVEQLTNKMKGKIAELADTALDKAAEATKEQLKKE